MDYQEEDKGKKAVEAAAEILGGTAAVGVQLLLDGATGALLSVPIATAAIEILKAGAGRLFDSVGRRQRSRLGAVAVFAAEQIKRNLDEGKKIRDDGFFDKAVNQRSSAEEILEGCLIKARDTFQEKKLKHLGRLYGNLPFVQISPDIAHHLIILADRLTYLQYQIMAVAEQLPNNLNPENYVGLGLGGRFEVLLDETFDLHRLGLLSFYDAKHQRGFIYLTPAEIRPALMMPSMMTGFLLADLLGLKEIDQGELQEIRTMFAPASPEFERHRKENGNR